MADAAYPAPLRQPEHAPFWDAAADGRLLVPRCTRCERTHWYPRPVCPFCQGETRWEEHDRRGTIYSYTVVAKSPRGPFALGYVELADGLRIYGGFREPFESLSIGAAVEITFADSVDGTRIPVFAPGATLLAPIGEHHEA